MPTIQRFEDIEAWKSARIMSNCVYDLTSKVKFARDFGLKDQIQRAAISAMSNIAEGFESQSRRSFVSYLFHARGSAAEVRSQLYIAFDRGYIDQVEFNAVTQVATSTSRLIAGFIAYLEPTRRQFRHRKTKSQTC